MSRVALSLLGTPEVTQDGEVVDGFRSLKARALLFYVAASGQPESRARLAGLLWGDLPEENANANLRKTLTNLRKLVGPHLAITRETVAVDETNPPWLDVGEFEAALDSHDPTGLETAVNLYRGDFLDGFYVREAAEFETWLLAERYRLRERLLAALQALAEQEARRGQFATATGYAQRLLALEPLREGVHRLLMSLFAQNGQRARALAQYDTCAQILARELGVEPGEKTKALFHQIRDGTLMPPPAPAAPGHNLPAPTTSFVGRKAELAHIERWLAEGTSRLLTIMGPGGAGKTRLAQQAGRQAINNFVDGVWTISLAPLEDVPTVVTTLAATLGITFFGKATPQEQVIRYLRRKALLLVLDNAEHLLSQAFAGFLVGILTQAPSVKIIVTSRQRLMMQAERVLHVPGLSYPDDATVASEYPAGQLFLQRAEGHGQLLPAMPAVDEAIHQLCRLVDGLPLALELAAAWTNALSLPVINAEIEREIAFLTTKMRDVPPRHRSIQAVFDTSWHLLDETERQLVRRLAYFRSGFAGEAVAEVVAATPAQLQALVHKSLLRAQDNGRYDMHELVRQYASGKLAQRPAEEEQVARHHGRYFTNFLAAREEAIQGATYLQAKAEIEAEVDNVRQAWEWAVATRSLQDIARSAETLHYYFLNTQGLFSEAAQRFQHAADQITGMASNDAGPLAGRLLLKAAVNRRMLGQLEEASRLVEESLPHFYRQELAADIARATSTLSVIRLQQNEKEAALRLAETALAQMRALDAPVDLCLCLNNLAYVLAHNGKYEAATAVAEESVALARSINYPHGELSAMNMLGVHYQWIGKTDKAKSIFQELVTRCRQTATQSRLAQAVNNLGALYKKRGEMRQALPLLQEAEHLYKEVGQIHYAAFVSVMLGELALEQGGAGKARRYCLQALQTAQEIEMPSLALDAFVLYARLLIDEGKNEEAVSVLAFVAHHPATQQDTREEVGRVLRPLSETMSPQAFAAAKDKGMGRTLDEVARGVMR